MRWTQEGATRRSRRDAYGEVVWFDAPVLALSLRGELLSATTVARRAVHRGEHEVSRKAIVQGRPECSRCPCMLVCTFVCANRTRDRGCSKHPVFPAPSSSKIRKPKRRMQSLEAPMRTARIRGLCMWARHPEVPAAERASKDARPGRGRSSFETRSARSSEGVIFLGGSASSIAESWRIVIL